MEDTGSPGMTLSTTKTMLRRIKTMGMVRKSLVMMYLVRFFIGVAVRGAS